VTVVRQDGAEAFPDHAPYDRIIVTVGVWDILPAWHEQLAHGGRLVAPITILPDFTLSVGLEKSGDALHSQSAFPCFFMPLRGTSPHPQPFDWLPRIDVTPKATASLPDVIRIVVEKDWSTFDIRWERKVENHTG
jgi:protein-L-isoaspartate(D-aspartate) O-methyltransferase